jgi:hypothetical protein
VAGPIVGDVGGKEVSLNVVVRPLVKTDPAAGVARRSVEGDGAARD